MSYNTLSWIFYQTAVVHCLFTALSLRIQVFFKVLSSRSLYRVMLLRMMTEGLSAKEAIWLLHCLLYVDDAVLTDDRHTLIELFKACETHSLQIGHR
jgi:hypothetical protein